MNTTEFKTGQKWRVVKASYVNDGMPEDLAHVRNGDLLVVQEGTSKYDREAVIAQTGDTVFITYDDISSRAIYLSEDSPEQPTETSGVPLSAGDTSVPEAAESVSQESTDSLNSKDILWHIINRAERYNGHSQFSVSDMDLETLMRLTRMLDDYVEEFCELRLSWAGDHMGYYTADIYEIASVCESAEDKILMQIGKVTGI